MGKISTGRYGELFTEKDTQGFNSLDFIHRFTSPLMALLFSELFWPNFIEIDNMIFLETTFEDKSDLQQLHMAIERYKGDRQKIEESFNTVEVPSLFGAKVQDTSDEEDIILANTLASMWRARLKEIFPKKKFVVKVLDSDQTEGEIAVLFRQL